MTDNVIHLREPDMTADELLENLKGKYQDFFVVGWSNDGFLATAITKEFQDIGSILFAFEMFKLYLLSGAYDYGKD